MKCWQYNAQWQTIEINRLQYNESVNLHARHWERWRRGVWQLECIYPQICKVYSWHFSDYNFSTLYSARIVTYWHFYNFVRCFICTRLFETHIHTSIFNKHVCFKQVVTCPTRGSNILDKIFTNCSSYYSVPVVLPPIGNVVVLSSNFTRNDPVGYKHVQRRDLNFDSINRW